MLRIPVCALAALLAAGCMYTAPQPVAPTYVPPRSGEDVVVTGGEGTEVLAEGMAALPAHGGADIARDNAIEDALRKAVEQGVGTYINSETRVENFQLLSDRVYSQTSGYVSSYRIINEELKGGLYQVVVRAVVKLANIEDDLAAIGLLVLKQGRPRVMVVVKEQAVGTISQTMLETAILDRFQQKGFPVVDAATVEENLREDQVKSILAGDDKTAALVGMKAGAEIIVTGTFDYGSSVKALAGKEREFHRYPVSARAINTETAEVLGASATATELPFSKDQAKDRAADTTATALMSKILVGWTKDENITVIKASNADYAKVQKLKSEIKAKMRGIAGVISRDLTGSSATIEVVSETTSREVMDGLGTRGLEIEFEVTGFAGNVIEIRFAEGGGK